VPPELGEGVRAAHAAQRSKRLPGTAAYSAALRARLGRSSVISPSAGAVLQEAKSFFPQAESFFPYAQPRDGTHSLGIVSISDTIPPVGPTTVIDSFSTINHFYGGQVGLVVDFSRGCWFLDFRGKLALGAISRVADINGSTTFLAGGTPTIVPGGLFAQSTNSGHHTNAAFSVVPELGVRAGCHITSYLRA
jgi:hypothetical protein